MNDGKKRARCFSAAAVGDDIPELELCALDAARAFFGDKVWVEISRTYTVRLAEANPCSETAREAIAAGKKYYAVAINVYEMVPE